MFIYFLSFLNYVFKKNVFKLLKFVVVKFDFLGGYGLYFYVYKYFLIYSRNLDWIDIFFFDFRKLIDSKDKKKF